MRISDWSSDVCSSDLAADRAGARKHLPRQPLAIRPAASAGMAEAFACLRCLWMSTPRGSTEASATPRAHPHGTGAPAMPNIEKVCFDRVLPAEIGRAACRDRVCQYVETSGDAGA